MFVSDSMMHQAVALLVGRGCRLSSPRTMLVLVLMFSWKLFHLVAAGVLDQLVDDLAVGVSPWFSMVFVPRLQL